MNPLIQLKTTPPLLIALALLCFAFLPKALAAPAPETPDPGSVGGTFNTADGTNALVHVTTGVANAAFGWFSLLSNTDGSFNTAVGAGTLLLNVGDQTTGEGLENTAVGAVALLFNTTGAQNTAVGAAALLNNTEGGDNTAVGAGALLDNTTGGDNTAVGRGALLNSTTGSENTANGVGALFSNTTGANNTAIGVSALFSNTTGANNTAIGVSALFNNTTGSNNTATGSIALGSNIDGGFNTANGDGALVNCTGSSNVAVGNGAGFGITTGNNIIAIGAGVSGVSTVGGEVDNSCYIGNIIGQPVTAGNSAQVFVDLDGKLGTQPSSQRFKHDIKPMEKASEAILAFKPVTFRYKSDAKKTPCFGLVAEEVEEVNPDLVVRDKNGEILSVRYDQVNAMLLNEFLKEHKKVEELKKEFQATIAHQRKQIEALTAGLQKVTAEIEATKPAPQMVLNK
jgi:hypothetical protein